MIRRGVIALAFVAASLPLWPLLGLSLQLFEPNQNPFSSEQSSFLDVLIGGRGPELFVTTLALATVVGAAALGIGTWLGWAEQRARYPGSKWLGLACLTPLAIPSYVLAGTLRHALGPGGPIGGYFGWPAFTGFWPAALALTLATVPYVQLLVSATLARVPAEEEEAARTLGASRFVAFRVVVLPRLRPALAFGLLLTQLYVISDFGAVSMLDCPVLNWRLYIAVNTQRLDHALALGLFVLVATVPLLMGARALQGRVRRGGVANPRSASPHSIRPATVVATYVLQAVVIALGALLPIATLIAWVAGGVAKGETFAPISTPIFDTLRVAALGAIITVLLAFPPAWVSARGRRATAWFLQQATYLTSALPGILLAFGLLLLALFASRRLSEGGALYRALTGGGFLLFAGYATRFLAEAFSALQGSVLGLDPRQDESARVLGAGPVRRFFRITLPALAPGVAVAMVLTFLAIMKELPVTLLLGGAMGLRTLSFRMYDRYQDAFLADAGLAGLLLVGLAFAALVVSLRYRHHV